MDGMEKMLMRLTDLNAGLQLLRRIAPGRRNDAEHGCNAYNSSYYMYYKGMTAMTAKTINVRVPEALYSQLEELARATTRSKSFLTIEALKGYLANESWQIRDIQEGIKEADAGNFASTEEVNVVFAKYGA